MAEFLQMLEFNSKSGVITILATPKGVEHIGEGGSIFIEEGRVIRAHSSKGKASKDAILYMLTIPEVYFEYLGGKEGVPQECDLKISGILMESMRLKDEVY